MDSLKAIKECVRIARGSKRLPQIGPCSTAHLVSMLERVTLYPEDFSEGKINRWLGYIQGVLVSYGVRDLVEMKLINKRCSDKFTPEQEKQIQDALNLIHPDSDKSYEENR